MNTITIYNTTVSLNEAETKIEHYKEMTLALRNGTMKPRQIVGTGYKNGRMEAERYLSTQIARYETLVQVMKEN
jgi:hypothetical protein